MVADEEVRLTLRIPGALRDQLTAAAGDSGRSMNAEIVARLAGTFDADATDMRIEERMNSLDERIAELARRQEELEATAKAKLDTKSGA